MTLRLREIIDANLQNALIKISARNVTNHGTSPLDNWSAWAHDFLGGSDDTVQDAETRASRLIMQARQRLDTID